MNTSVELRSAELADVGQIHRLITENLEAGHLLPRTVEDLEQHAARFIVATLDERVIGCAELAPLSPGVAEVRSLVVDAPHRGQHVESRLVAHVAAAGTARGFSTLCAFTHEPSRFVHMGFTIVPHTSVSEKIAHDCTSCLLFRHCGRSTVMLPLRAGVSVRPERPAALIQGSRAVAPRRPNVERLQLRPLQAREAEQTEAVPA